MSSVRGYDNLYNESVNDIALMNYNKGIAHRLRLQEQEMQTKLPFKEPKMLSGGVRPSNSILPGTSIEAVPRVVGGRASRRLQEMKHQQKEVKSAEYPKQRNGLIIVKV